MSSDRFVIQAGQLLAVFNSAHRVMKAESVLKNEGIEILLIPAPRSLMTECGLALRFNDEVMDKVLKVLAVASVLPDFVSKYDGSGFNTVWENR